MTEAPRLVRPSPASGHRHQHLDSVGDIARIHWCGPENCRVKVGEYVEIVVQFLVNDLVLFYVCPEILGGSVDILVKSV